MSHLIESPFDDVPEVYDRVRPEYPAALYDELFPMLPPQPDILEVGAGTGQATGDMLARGARVTAIELGPNIAAFLRRKFENESRLTVINSAFETATISPNAFDCLVAATSFHWFDPETRFERTHRALRPRGRIAIIDTNQIASDVDRGFFERCQFVYDRWGRGGEYEKQPGEELVPYRVREVKNSKLFEDVQLFRYRCDQTYTTADYRDLVTSYSVTQAMDPEPREGLLDGLVDLIEAEFDGYVVRPLLVTLVTARAVG